MSPPTIVFENFEEEMLMPFDALIVSLAVTAVFVGFAATLGWVDHFSH
jgi:hypothetical protein